MTGVWKVLDSVLVIDSLFSISLIFLQCGNDGLYCFGRFSGTFYSLSGVVLPYFFVVMHEFFEQLEKK